MSDTTQPSINPTPPSGGTSRTSQIIIGVLAVAVIGLGAGYFFKSNELSKKEDDVVKLTEDNNELETEIDKLNEEAKALSEELATANKTAEEKSAELQKMQSKIAAYMAQVNKLTAEGKIATSEKEKFKGKYEQLEFYNDKYRKEIAKLQEEIDRLRAENDTLRSKVTVTDRKVEELETVKQTQENMIQQAKLLIASDFEFVGINNRGKRLETDDIKAKKIKTLQTCFVLNRNPIVRPVKQDVYMVVLDPNGNTYQSLATSSGYFTLNDKKTVYTAKGVVKYDGSRQNVCIDYVVSDDSPLKSGDHVANVYTTYENSSDSYLLGTTRFTIK